MLIRQVLLERVCLLLNFQLRDSNRPNKIIDGFIKGQRYSKSEIQFLLWSYIQGTQLEEAALSEKSLPGFLNHPQFLKAPCTSYSKLL